MAMCPQVHSHPREVSSKIVMTKAKVLWAGDTEVKIQYYNTDGSEAGITSVPLSGFAASTTTPQRAPPVATASYCTNS